jgi:hypothetical protein
MKKAKSLVFLAHYPFFLIELNIYDIFSVLAVIDRVIINSCRFYCKRQRDLKEKSSIKAVIFATSFNMFNKDLCWEEYLAEFALH